LGKIAILGQPPGEFQLSYAIVPSSSIKASLDSLVKKGILYRTGIGSYQFSDIFMRHWILSLQQSNLGA
jgi:hypothetical protein